MPSFEIQEYDLAQNPTPRCPCILVLDTSGSMHGEPIQELNEGIKLFYQAIENDEIARWSVEIGIVTFSYDAHVHSQINSIEGPVPPTLQAGGSTSLGQGIELSLGILDERKRIYQQSGISYYQPWMVLMTDGEPTDEWKYASDRVHQLSKQKKLSFFGIAVGDAANMEILKMICPPERPPVRLRGLQFNSFFEWLSQSMSMVSCSTTGSSVNLPEIRGWADITV
jgi:uncharacterized protein YegL